MSGLYIIAAVGAFFATLMLVVQYSWHCLAKNSLWGQIYAHHCAYSVVCKCCGVCSHFVVKFDGLCLVRKTQSKWIFEHIDRLHSTRVEMHESICRWKFCRSVHQHHFGIKETTLFNRRFLYNKRIELFNQISRGRSWINVSQSVSVFCHQSSWLIRFVILAVSVKQVITPLD